MNDEWTEKTLFFFFIFITERRVLNLPPKGHMISHMIGELHHLQSTVMCRHTNGKYSRTHNASKDKTGLAGQRVGEGSLDGVGGW